MPTQGLAYYLRRFGGDARRGVRINLAPHGGIFGGGDDFNRERI